MSICIIFNPAARGEKARRFQQSLESFHDGFVLKPTTAPAAARRLAAEAIAEGHTTLVAAGGDGTLNEVLNGIGDVPDGFDRVRLAVLPLGTINVFARELRIPLKLPEVWRILEDPHEVPIDVGCAEFGPASAPERRYFLQLAGAGLDARSVELVNWELKKKIGPGAYVVAGLQALSGTQTAITISNGRESVTGELVLIGNGKLYGGDFPIFHKSDLQDGVLDAVIFEKVNWQRIPGIVWDFLSGRMFQEGSNHYLQGAEFTLGSDSRAALQLDGELAGELPARISVLPRRLKVVTSRSGKSTF